jgi:LemA protein
MIFIIASVTLLIIIFWIISVQHSFIALDENITHAMSQVCVELSLCWDALSSLLDLTKEYSSHEYDMLSEAINARRIIIIDSSPDAVMTQENIISGIIDAIMSLSERFPEMKTEARFLKAMDIVNQYQNMLHTTRLIYNDGVTKLNRALRIFPASIISSILGFSTRAYLKAPAEKAIMPFHITDKL